MFELTGKPVRIVATEFGSKNSFGRLAVSLYTAGCNLCCKGCHNKWLWDYYVESKLKQGVDEIVSPYAGTFNWITILGGEPLMNDKHELLTLIKDIKKYNYKVLMYTGYEFEDLPQEIKDVLDAVKVGRYDSTLEKDNWDRLSTENQKLWVKGEDNIWKQSTQL